ncbi:DUF551 domain-containing protein [Enterobacter hormaechei subsp. steigerwaltii]|uniref:DUF551 domain-containing protein n=2 Tax=Enterobacter hormaechei TaxID=158836 RepID=UPI003F43EFA1
MSTITKEFTKEQLQQIIETDHVQCGEASALARIALASLESEPVAWLLSGGGAKNNVSFDSGNAYADPLREVTPLYTAPPAPVSVPDDVLKGLLPDAEKAEFWFEHNGIILFEGVKFNNAVFDACRAAMLQGAEPVTTAYKLPDGWVACSERMPEDGDKVLTSFRGGMRTAVCKVVDVLGHKIFVDELTLFNGVPADHWQPLPAAPQQE